MGTRQRAVDVGAAQARAINVELAREFRESRLDRAVSQKAVGDEVGVTRGWVSLFERGLLPNVTVHQSATFLAAVGLSLHARAYPGGPPIRDAAHTRLLERFRLRLHRSLKWATEVPLPIHGDLRAWDGLVTGHQWVVGVEAETRPRDLQALKRRIGLKARDGNVDRVLLLLLDSRANRQLLRADADALAEAFPLPGTRALELLGAGVRPEGNAIVFL